MIELHEIGADDWRLWRELRLEALREAPYAFSARLSDWQGDGDVESRWRGRLTDVPFNVVAYLDGVPAGIVSGVAPDEERAVLLISMWVAPFARGRGVGDALVQAVIRWAGGQGALRVVLAVRDENLAAIAFYARMGFVDAGAVAHDDDSPAERLMVCELASRR